MILSIGEILIDTYRDDVTTKHCVGGAPFNVAVNIKQCGGTVGFIGRVGDDKFGRFIIDECQKAQLDYLQIEKDPYRATTEAVVTLRDGERDFKFLRDNTADYHIDVDNIDLSTYNGLNIVHLGSLMLSEEAGRNAATRIVDKIDKQGARLSFDVNFRLDLYEDIASAIRAYEPFVRRADIVKFSFDELCLYTGQSDITAAIAKVKRRGQLLLVTFGDRGSMYVLDDDEQFVATEKVHPIDTTGAGDAFFGAVLSSLDGKCWNKTVLRTALAAANKKGANSTQFLGAIKL